MRTILALLCSIFCLLAQESEFDLARAAFEKAMREEAPDRKVILLEESLRHVKSFEAFYALGNLQLGQRQFPAARKSFESAIDIAKEPAALAAAYFKLGLACEGQSEMLEAISWLEHSLERSPDPLVESELKRMRLKAAGQVQSAAAIARALTVSKSLGAAPKVNLQVNFEFNEAVLALAGKNQAEELGKLLTQPGHAGFRFVFIGHTDLKGGEDYNLNLSQKRAETVVRFLVERYSVPSNRVKALGRGMREPLYRDLSNDSDRLNRRVEVRLEPAK